MIRNQMSGVDVEMNRNKQDGQKLGTLHLQIWGNGTSFYWELVE